MRQKKTPGCYRGLPRSVSPSAVLEHGPPLEPRNGRVTDSIRPADIGQRLAGLAACNGFLNLEWTQLWLASEPDAPCLRSFPPLRCSGQDRRSFEFRQGSEHGQDRLAVWAGRVDHRISNRLEWRLLVPAFGLSVPMLALWASNQARSALAQSIRFHRSAEANRPHILARLKARRCHRSVTDP